MSFGCFLVSVHCAMDTNMEKYFSSCSYILKLIA
jgi:hypothetical protein